MLKNIIVLLVSIFCGTILAGTIDPTTPDDQYLAYGNKFKYVLRIHGKDDRNGLYAATAVAIDKHWILTAAHIVNDCVSAKVIDDNNKEYCLSKIIVHSGYGDKQFGWHDIALGYTEEAINLDFFPALYAEPNEVGKLCSIAGYGFTGTFHKGYSHSDGKKRAGSNFVDEIDRDLLVCSPSRKEDKLRTQLEFLIASGDSGGGLFIDQKLAGINSCIMATDKKTDSTYNDCSGHTRISQHIKWIEENMRNEDTENKESKVIKFQTSLLTEHYSYLMTSLYLGINLAFFLVGYLWCKLSLSSNSQLISKTPLKSISRNVDIEKQELANIDSRKIVVSINTDNLEKKYEQLGDIKKSEENITNSVSKLKNMKG